MDSLTLWTVIFALGIGSFLLRFSFLGLVGRRPLPDWLQRHLRYTAVAVIPALVAPLVVWTSGPEGAVSPAQIIAGIVTLLVGRLSGNIFAAIATGAIALALGLWLLPA